MAATTLPTTVDMSTLSHSELHSLSLLTATATATATATSPFPHLHDVTTSTSFNHSPAAATNPNQRHHHRHVGTGFSDIERSESLSIVRLLKRYLKTDGRFKDTTPDSRNVGNLSIEIVNKNGVVVDLLALEERENGAGGGPFEEELRRISQGTEKEDELLKVLAGLKGNWCSNRRKRRVVDACLLGDALPVGWKVIIALRRKGGRFTPYCRRYISPTGEHLSSCKEISSYLKPYLGINESEVLRDGRGELHQQRRVDSNNLQCLNSVDDTSLVNISCTTTSNTCLTVVPHEKDVCAPDIDNLPDAQVSDSYECHSCNICFHAKDNYLQHLLSIHEKTTKRFNLGSSVGDKVAIRDGNYDCHTCNIRFDVKDKYFEHLLFTHKKKPKKRRLISSVTDGVIIRDGKYECQFCDKIFEEKCRYIGHVGNHVKGSIKKTKDSALEVPPKTPRVARLPAEIGNSKMNALIEIAQNTIQDVFPSEPGKEPSCISNLDQFCINSNIKNADFVSGKSSSFCIDSCGVGKPLSSQLTPCSKVNRTSNYFTRENGKDDGKDKTTYGIEKDGTEARAAISTEVSHSCGIMSGKTMSNGTTDGSTFCCSVPETEKYDREERPSELKSLPQVSAILMADREMKEEAFTRRIVGFEHESCFDAMKRPAVTGNQGGSSTSDCVVKSTLTKDEGFAEGSDGGLKICVSPSNTHSVAAQKIQIKYIDKYEAELALRHDNSGLARGARAFGCTTLSNSSSPFDEIFEKAGQNGCSLDPNLESGIGFEEYMKLDDIEPEMYKYNAMNGEDSIFLPEVSMELENDTGFDLARFNASVNTRSEFPEAIAGRSTITMTCVWCGSEFSHEVIEIEQQSDSVGFMCPACRAKISKQFNELESNFSVDPHYS